MGPYRCFRQVCWPCTHGTLQPALFVSLWFSEGCLLGVRLFFLQSLLVVNVATESLQPWTYLDMCLLSDLKSVPNHKELLMNSIWTPWVNRLMCDTAPSILDRRGQGGGTCLWWCHGRIFSTFSIRQFLWSAKTTAESSVRQPKEEESPSDRLPPMRTTLLTREWNRVNNMSCSGWLKLSIRHALSGVTLQLLDVSVNHRESD